MKNTPSLVVVQWLTLQWSLILESNSNEINADAICQDSRFGLHY